MDPISNNDRLVLLLRQKLQERAKTTERSKTSNREAPPPTGIKALAAVEGVEERALRRAFIQHLLAHELGPELINDAQFQQIVSRVTETIEEDEGAARLLTQLIAQLRA